MDRVGTGGGSLALAELIDEHGGFLVADFADHYSLRLADVLFGWSPSEVLALVEGLPDTCRFHAHVSGGKAWRDFVGWGRDRHMFADWIDVYSQAHTPERKKPWTYPRPGSKPQNAGTPFTAMIPRRNPGGD